MKRPALILICLLLQACSATTKEPEDDVLMQKAAGLAGGVRFGPDGNEVIPASPDVADMTEDDVMLMTVSEGIAGGVRYG